ncbi:MAG: tyrosine-type recombinase/integrase [Propioniciclava sp.]
MTTTHDAHAETGLDHGHAAEQGWRDEPDEDDGHLDGLRRLGLPVVDRHEHGDRVATVHPLPGEQVALEDAAVAASTREKYRVGWVDWCAWCDLHGVGPYEASPLDVRRWLETLRTQHLAVSTVHGRLAAVSWWYERAGRPSPAKHPTIRRAVTGYARLRGTAVRRARPLMLDDLRTIVAGIPTVLNLDYKHPRVVRDRALLTLGWATARRSAELVGLDVEDLAFHGDPDTGDGGGVLVNIARSKTDQPAAGYVVGVPYSRHLNSCPVRAAMLQARRQRTGPLFVGINRHGHPQTKRLHRNTVTALVKEYVERILLEDPTHYSSHSLRAGLVTEATQHGVPDRLITRTTGHADTRLLTRYDRPGEHFTHNALQGEWW